MRLFMGLIALFLLCANVQAQHIAKALPPVVDTGGRSVDVVALSDSIPVVAIRFLGSMCSHCMRQLLHFKRQTEEFSNAGACIVAFSDNDVETCHEVTEQYQFDPRVFKICSDVNNVCSKSLGSSIVERDGSVTELHALLILHKREVLFEHYSTTPLMDVESILSKIPRR